MFACMALCAWNWPVQQAWLWRAGLFVVFIMGAFASIFSGTRAAWLAFFLLAGVYLVYLFFSRSIKIRYLLPALCACVLVLYGMGNLPQLRINERMQAAHDEVAVYVKEGRAETGTSIGERLQMWGYAWNLYKQKPVFGWTYKGYMQEQNKISTAWKGFPHPHQEWLNIAAKSGTAGLLGLLLVYVVPLLVFVRLFKVGYGNPRLRALGSAGILMPIAYFGFGLVDVILAHTALASIYCYLMVLIWAAYLAVQAESEGNGASRIYGSNENY